MTNPSWPPTNSPSGRFVGLMSGTSLDAVDAAIVRWDEHGAFALEANHCHYLPDTLREQIEAISHPGDNEIDRMGELDRALGLFFAEATQQLLANASLTAADITAIGSHGQTIRHRPSGAGEHGFTLQIGDPNTIAALTSITTVADFRRRDVALGGEGAPLAPAFHADQFGAADCNRAVVNIGGFSNISLLEGKSLVSGFDCGPGNTLLDAWHARHRGEAFDRGGQWSAEGRENPDLLAAMQAHPFLARSGPRSTGKEMFNLAWLEQLLDAQPEVSPQEVQATLAEFTAYCIARDIAEAPIEVAEVYICGGGAHNDDLMRRIFRQLPGCTLASTEALGLHPDWVEAAAFAWLARQTLSALPGNAPAVTGATEATVLGAIFPANR